MTHVRTRDDGSPVRVDTTSIIAMLYEAFPGTVAVTSDLAHLAPDIDDEGYHLVSCVCDDCYPDRMHDA
jgi:hypothetical protein